MCITKKEKSQEKKEENAKNTWYTLTVINFSPLNKRVLDRQRYRGRRNSKRPKTKDEITKIIVKTDKRITWNPQLQDESRMLWYV